MVRKGSTVRSLTHWPTGYWILGCLGERSAARIKQGGPQPSSFCFFLCPHSICTYTTHMTIKLIVSLKVSNVTMHLNVQWWAALQWVHRMVTDCVALYRTKLCFDYTRYCVNRWLQYFARLTVLCCILWLIVLYCIHPWRYWSADCTILHPCAYPPPKTVLTAVWGMIADIFHSSAEIFDLNSSNYGWLQYTKIKWYSSQLNSFLGVNYLLPTNKLSKHELWTQRDPSKAPNEVRVHPPN